MDAKQTIFEILGNNSFNLKILNETLWEIKENCFNTLYNAQRALASINKYHIEMDDYIIEESDTYVFNINCTFIDNDSRDVYRKSRFYNKNISLDDIAKNPHIFTNTVLLFINGELYTNFKIKIQENLLQLIFKIGPQPIGERVLKTGFTKREFEHLVYGVPVPIKFYDESDKIYRPGDIVKYTKDNGIVDVFECMEQTSGTFDISKWSIKKSVSKMTLITIPNCATAQSDIDDHTFNRFNIVNMIGSYHGIPLDILKPYLNNIKPNKKCMSFVTMDDDHLYKYQLLDDNGILNAQKNDKGYTQIIDIERTQLMMGESTVRLIRLYHNLNQLDKININGGNFFELPIKDMPIPVENMLVFRYDNHKVPYYDHDAEIIMHYPNIYEVKTIDNGPFYGFVYVYYADDTISIGNKHENELQLYYKFTENVLSKYRDRSIPALIKKYKPIDVNYSIPDYKIAENKNMSTDDNSVLYITTNDHLSYKLDRFKDLIRQNGFFYKLYLNKLVASLPIFKVHVKDIQESDNKLGDRRRTDNKSEISELSSQKVFDEERYLFIFRHDGDNENLILFLDNSENHNIPYHPDEIYHDDKYTYVYIPMNLIDTNTVLHVEKYYDITFNQDIDYNQSSEEYIRINIPADKRLSVNDLFVTYKNGNNYKYILNTEDMIKYKFYTKDSGTNEYIEIDEDSFYNYTDIYIKIVDESLLNIPISIKANKIAFSKKNIGNGEFVISEPIDTDDRNILVFKNGRLLPKEAVKIDFNENIDGPHTVRSLVYADSDDEFILIYTPNKYTNVLELDEIPSSGVVNLEGLIDKPIDLKWHDIFINGIRLTEDNIDMLTPYSFILKDVNTLTYVTIYEKNLDSDVFAPEYDTSNINNIILNNDAYIELPEEGTITEEYTDIRDDIVIDIIGFLDEYLNYIGLINPDISQITDDMLSEYGAVFDISGNMFINPDKYQKFAKDIYLNPDAEANIHI